MKRRMSSTENRVNTHCSFIRLLPSVDKNSKVTQLALLYLDLFLICDSNLDYPQRNMWNAERIIRVNSNLVKVSRFDKKSFLYIFLFMPSDQMIGGIFFLSICLSLCPSVRPSVRLCLSVRPSVCLSLSLCLSYLSVYDAVSVSKLFI